MSRSLTTIVLIAGLCTASSAMACGEGIFRMGGGLRYQGYLASNPAQVLVYDTARTRSADRIGIYRGLAQAGHRVTIARDQAELSRALARRHYDVVIASTDEAATVATLAPATGPTPKWLRVASPLAPDGRPTRRSRHEAYVTEGAGLGQYLRSINRLLGS